MLELMAKDKKKTDWNHDTYYIQGEEASKRHEKKIKSELRLFIKDSHITDLEFALEIINNLEDWKAVLRILGKRNE